MKEFYKKHAVALAMLIAFLFSLALYLDDMYLLWIGPLQIDFSQFPLYWLLAAAIALLSYTALLWKTVSQFSKADYKKCFLRLIHWKELLPFTLAFLILAFIYINIYYPLFTAFPKLASIVFDYESYIKKICFLILLITAYKRISIFQRYCRLIFRAAFGDIQWSMPKWLQQLLDYPAHIQKLKNIWGRFRNFSKAKPKVFAAQIASLFVLAASMGAYYYIEANKPIEVKNIEEVKLVQTGFIVNEPGETRYILNKESKVEKKISELSLSFINSVAPLKKIGKEITEGLILRPEIPGVWKWESENRIVFTPQEDWKLAQEYRLILEPEKLLRKNISLDKVDHYFEIPGFRAGISSLQFYEDPKEPSKKKVIAQLNFNHPVNVDSIKGKLKLNLKEYLSAKKKEDKVKSREIKYTVVPGKLGLNLFLHSEYLKIPKFEAQVNIKMEKGIANLNQSALSTTEDNRNVRIPGMFDYFRFRSSYVRVIDNEKGIPEHILLIESNTALAEKELLKHLEVYELPIHSETQKNKKYPFNWSYNTKLITEKILAESTKLEIEALPTERELPSLRSFRLKSAPGRFLLIKIRNGATSVGGYLLASDYNSIQKVPAYPKTLRISHQGAILNMEGEKKLSVLSRGIKELEIEIGQVLPGEIHHFLSQNSGSFINPRFNHYFTKNNLAHYQKFAKKINGYAPEKSVYSVINFKPYLDKRFKGRNAKGLFFFTVRDKRGSYRDSRFILLTDLGIVVKRNLDASSDIFVQSLRSGKPMAAVNVSILGQNGLAMFSGKTNSKGHISFPKFDRKGRQRPKGIVVTKGNDVAFIRQGDYSRLMSFSRFEVSGVSESSDSNALNAFLFSDRGIYRPGEEFHIGMIVRPKDWKQNIQGTPLEVELIDPRGMVLQKRKLQVGSYGFDSYSYRLSETAQTGKYRINLYVTKFHKEQNYHSRDILGSRDITVEEFQPDKLKISTRFSKNINQAWLSPKDLKGFVSLRNLFGTPAVDRKIEPTLSLSPSRIKFPAYRDHSFFDPFAAERNFKEELASLQTNEQGEAEFDLNLEKYSQNTFHLKLHVEGFEADSGRSVVSQVSAIISPLKYLVGYKADGSLSYIKKNSDREIEILAINEKSEQIAVENLRIEIEEKKYVSALVKQASGALRYQSVLKRQVIKKEDFVIAKAASLYKLPTDLSGDFTFKILNKDDKVLNRFDFSVAGTANLSRSLTKNSELVVRLNKEDYDNGEEIELQIKAPYAGSGLITIERDKVYAHKWFRTNTTSSVQKIRVPKNLEGNAYINIAFSRSIRSKEIYMSPFSYSVQPFSISRKKRENRIEIETLNLAKPGEPFKIRYKTNRKTKIAIFAIDEGILQVAKYKLPEPLKHFFKKRALSVRTWQILDLILPEHSLVNSTLAPGGGFGGRIAQNLNPFARKVKDPVAFWTGIIDSNTKWQEVFYQVPSYFNGSLRVMAVAVNDSSIGTFQKTAKVRSDIIIQPNSPLFVAPGDKFKVSVMVANNILDSGKDAPIQLSLKSSANLKVIGKSEHKIAIDELRDKTVHFELEALQKLGNADLNFTAKYQETEVKFADSTSVRPISPFSTSLWAGSVKDGSALIKLDRSTYEKFSKRELSFSPLPLGAASGVLKFLRKYPYGCTEQLVSKAFPFVALTDQSYLSISKKESFKFFDETLRMLRYRHYSDGGFGLYAGQSPSRNFITLYVAHYLIEAKEQGFDVPKDMLTATLSKLKDIANNYDEHFRHRAYATYLLTRSAVVTTAFLSNLEEEIRQQNWEELYKGDLAFAYMAASYAILSVRESADKYINLVKMGDFAEDRYRNYYSRLQKDSQILYLFSKHFPERLKDIKSKFFTDVVEYIRKQNYNSLSSSYLILGLTEYVRASKNTKLGAELMKSFSVFYKAKNQEGKLEQKPFNFVPRIVVNAKIPAKYEELLIKNSKDLNLFFTATHAGFDRNTPQERLISGIEIAKQIKNTEGEELQSVKLGEEVELHLSIRSIDGKNYNDVAIVDLLPGGFELVTSSSPSQYSNSLGVATKGTDLEIDYVNAREDRVIIYGSVSTEVKKFVYKIKAVNKGDYSVPPGFAEYMYNKKVKSITKASKISVLEKN